MKDHLERLVPVIEPELSEAAQRRNSTAESTERVRVLEILHRISVAAGGVVEVGRLAQLTVEGAVELVGADGALLRWYSEEEEVLFLIGSTSNREWAPPRAVAPVQSVLGAAFRNKAPVVENDHQTSDEVADSVRLKDVTAMVAVPLMVGDRAAGALGVITYGDRRFDNGDATILSLLGREIANAIERAELNSELVESEERFRGAFEGSGVGMVLSEQGGSVVQVNKAICEMVGEPADAVIGRRLRELIDPLDLEAFDRLFQHQRAGSGHGAAELRVRHRDGRLVWGRFHVSVISRVGGATTYVLTQVEDITPVRAAGAELLASEARAVAVAQASLDGLIVVDEACRIVDFNPAATSLFGVLRETALGCDVFDLIFPPRLRGGSRARMMEQIAAGREARFGRTEVVLQKADSRELQAEISVVRLETGAGPLFATSIRDLTDRDQLTRSRALLAEVVASAPVILFAFGADGRVTLAEGRLLDRLADDPSRLIGTSVFAAARKLSGTLEHIERALAGESFAGRIDLPALDLWLEASYRPIRDQDGKVVGVAGIGVDVSDQVRGEAARQESDAKSRLVAMVNHEIRTPLNTVIGFAELLRLERTGPLNEKQLRYVSNVEAGGRHLLALINDSLDLSRIVAGKMDVEMGDIDLVPILDQAVEQVQPLVAPKGLKVSVRSGRADWIVRADRRRLLQILWNLLSNAIRHTESGGTITIDVKGSGEGIQVLVSDTGVGIASDQLSRIFDEYSQVPGTKDGTGLGLPVSRQLAQLMAGDLVVTSEVGVGTTFTIELAAGRS